MLASCDGKPARDTHGGLKPSTNSKLITAHQAHHCDDHPRSQNRDKVSLPKHRVRGEIIPWRLVDVVLAAMSWNHTAGVLYPLHVGEVSEAVVFSPLWSRGAIVKYKELEREGWLTPRTLYFMSAARSALVNGPLRCRVGGRRQGPGLAV